MPASFSSGTISGGTLTGSGDVTFTGTLNWTGGTMGGSGKTIIASGGTLNISNVSTNKSLNRILQNDGTATWTGGTMSMTGGRFDNNGSFTANSASTLQSGGQGGTNAFNNAGSFTKLGSGQMDFLVGTTAVPFNNTGTVDVQAGTLTLNAGGTNSNAIGVGASGTLALTASYTHGASSSLTGAGTVTISSGTHSFPAGTFNPTGTVNFTSGTSTVNNSFTPSALGTIAATVTFNSAVNYTGAVTISGSASFAGAQSFSGLILTGTLTGAGDVTVTGILNWNGGTMSGTGKTIITDTGTLSIDFTGTKGLQRNLDIHGRAAWSGGNLQFSAGAVLTSNNNFRSSSFFGNWNAQVVSGGGAFVNNGTFEKIDGGTISFTTLPFNNTGTVDVQAGTLTLSAGGTNSNAIGVGASGTLALTASYTHGASSSLTGAGTVTISSGTHSFPAGTFTPTGTVNFSGSTTTVNNTFTPTALGALNSGTITLNAVQSFPGLALAGAATLTGAGDVTVNGTLNWTGGTMSGPGQTIIAAGGTLNLSGSSRTLSRTLQNDGTATWTVGTIQMSGGTFTNNGSFTANSASILQSHGQGGTNAFNNAGTFTKLGTGETRFFVNSTAVAFNNTGTVDVQAGTLTLSAGVTQHVGTTLTAGTWIARNAGTINISTGSNILTNQGAVMLDGTGSSFAKINTLTTNTGTFTLAGGRDFAATPSGGTFTNSGTLNLGAGSVLSVTGAFTQPGSAINVDIAGPVAGTDFGQVTATGTVNLNGSLNANLVGGYDPGFAASFPVVVGASRTGTFSTFGGSGSTTSGRLLRDRYTATSAVVSVRPLAPSAADLIASSDSGVSNSDDITNINTPTFDGTATDVATVRIYADGNLVGSAPVGGGGAWSATASALLDGTRVITATIIDADGDESPVSGSLSVTIDTLAPAQPGAMDLQTASDSGVSGIDNITNVNTPVFDLASTDTYHRVERNGGQITGDYATGTTLAEGTLADGSYSYVLLAVDAAGNVSTPSGALVVTIDTVAPAVPGSPDLQAGSDSGVSSTDNITNINTPTFDVTSTDTYHRFFRDGGLVSALYASGGTFSETARPDGTFDYTLRAVDAAGNVSGDSATLSVTIDTVAPAVPGAPDLQAGSDSGVSNTDNITNVTTPTFDVTSTDAFYRFFRDGGLVSGDYATGPFTSSALADGSYGFSVRAVDAAGNASASGPELVVQIDTVGLAAPSSVFLFETGHSMQFVFGEDVSATLVNGDIAVQNLTGGGTVGTALAYSNPTASFTFTGFAGGILPDGNYRATIAAANVTDLAGNPLPGDAVLDFFVFAGDANRDRVVNITDFSILASRFNQPGTFSQGDFNYDGIANIADFAILASKFNTTLPAPGSLARQSAAVLPGGTRVAPALEPRRVFSDLRLDDAEALPGST